MFSLNCVVFCAVMFAGQTSGLVELPPVDDNNILTTEAVIRDTINTLFYKLGLRGIKTKPRLKEYSTVHNHLVSFTLQDYTNLKEIAKLTRVDKIKMNNETRNFMTVINELLNEDVVEKNTEATITGTNDVSVVKYIDQFLSKLEIHKRRYGVTNELFPIKDEIYKILKDDNMFFYNVTMDNASNSDLEDNDTLIDDNEFWKPDVSGRRIYRGDRTKIKYFPFMASIQIFNKFHCAGSIIKSDLIITASSCLQLAWNNRFFRENPAYLSVRVGSNFYNGGGENIPVLEVYFHPKYNPKNLWNNICILRLVRKLHFKKRARKIKKIDFDRRPSNLPLTTDGITIVGWGAKGMSNIVKNPWTNILSFAVLDYYPLQECQEIYSREYVTHKNFCAGFFSKGGGACNRDVGGPGVVSGILMGVISFGSPVCGTPDAPTVFTKLGYYTDWIEEIMEQDVPSVRQRTTTTTRPDITYGQYYQPIQPTTFKIPPLSDKLSPIPISEVDALRMLQNGNLFQEFLNTMFGPEKAAEYTELIEDETPRENKKKQYEQPTLSRPMKMPVRISDDFTPVSITEDSLQGLAKIVTDMGMVEPDVAAVTDMGDNIMQLNENTDEDVKVFNNKEYEKDLVSVIDNINLKEIIDGLPSAEEEKLLENDKILDVLQEKGFENRMAKIDDRVLTLLYLSDSEKAANEANDKQLSVEYEDPSTVESDDGISIAVDREDTSYRNRNTSDPYYLPRESYYLVTSARNTTQTPQWDVN